MIPNNIIVTWKNKSVPAYILPNIERHNLDKRILFYDDNDVKQFLIEEYDSSYVDFFNGLKLGCTKGDFFRYCYLYKYGGYYADIDIMHLMPISQYIDSTIDFFSIISVMSYLPNPHLSIFQALLYCVPEHPVLKMCITSIMSPEAKADEFYCTTQDMYAHISSYINEPNLQPTDYTKYNLSLGREIHTNYGFACVKNENIIALSRYPNYIREKGFTQ